ncbi:carboxy-S-adenosyl-L-methionine synthase CmoA [Oceanicoccus sagamiensis]|uniref:Carboxy-S-adenosyl-L-methionine synthase n=1 Tax=Oceanicoccus sagamiensis TaxID=716816 RepID=A0A1X9NDY4_9GAMM|nr:carboxy-S-adenosyl-L-methionine synthase CmoA [Oceanicoccus sagamiensis]ARN74632.1 carboxy-S-adenosyl-L-methionine synthase CmoA [Oceanicoccus sagamiensis]
MSDKDSIYSQPLGSIANFSFDEKVVQVFPDMIQRSVPGYSTIIAMTGVLAERYAQTHSHCYDLGSSLGASTLAMRQQLDQRDCKIIAVDNSAAMQQRCQQIIDQDTANTPVELVEANIQDVDIENASVVVLNFTLQFISKEERQTLLAKIYNGMLDGGILVLSEKFCFDDPHLQELNTDLHHSFKRANGYSDMEISQKRTALENVLLPETIATHQQRLKTVGFHSVDVWFQCFNFASLVAIKGQPPA